MTRLSSHQHDAIDKPLKMASREDSLRVLREAAFL